MTNESDPPAGGRSGVIQVGGAPTTVYLVDDDTELREVAHEILTDDGYAVTSAADGKEALERLAAMADAHVPLPDVLVMDFVMPKLSGLGVLRALWRLGRLPPTIIVTGFPDPSVDVFAKKLGAFRVLRKPFEMEDLCAAVGEAAALRSKETKIVAVGESPVSAKPRFRPPR
jgi:CheY-like chemotaxis protein